MAGRPLRPATDRRLGKPLPHQLANPISATPKAKGPCGSPPFPLRAYAVLIRLSPSYPPLPDMFRYITHPFATRHQGCPRAAVRLACVKHAASVQSEPGSNSSVQFLFWSIAGPVLLKVNHLHDLFRLCVSTSVFLKSSPHPKGLGNFPKTKHLHSSVVRLFC